MTNKYITPEDTIYVGNTKLPPVIYSIWMDNDALPKEKPVKLKCWGGHHESVLRQWLEELPDDEGYVNWNFVNCVTFFIKAHYAIPENNVTMAFKVKKRVEVIYDLEDVTPPEKRISIFGVVK